MNNSIKELGYMLDCSRGAVARVSTLKRLIDILAKWGYTYLMLYTEDTYQIDEEPYFGYMRGAYSRSELQEIDAYAAEHKIELRPCIQTLAHLGRLRTHDQFDKYFDNNDILLVRSEDTYRLIDEMFKNLSLSIHSRRIHIGMDEAFMLGRGRYIDLYGYEKKDQIIEYHLKRVAEIAKKYDYECYIWGDMLLNAYNEDKEHFHLDLPANVTPFIWRYGPLGKEKTEEEIQAYLKICNRPLAYAGGVLKWVGFVPGNGWSFTATSEQIEACKRHGIADFLVTGWGDGAADASQFSILPGLFQASCLAHDVPFDEKAKEQFGRDVGLSFADFMQVDRLALLEPKADHAYHWNNLSFIHLYNDVLQNQVIEAELDKYPAAYEKAVADIAPISANKEFGYLFATLAQLGRVDEYLCTLGRKALEAYQRKESLKPSIAQAEKAYAELEKFIPIYVHQWNHENKSFGLEKQLIRLGGLKERLAYAIATFKSYEDREIPSIDEYEAKHLPKIMYGQKIDPDTLQANFYRYLVSAGILND